MPGSSKSSPPNKFKRGVKYAGLALVVLICFAGCVYLYAFARFVPPIFATVVDAITDKPVSGANVCLDVTHRVWEMHEEARKETKVASANGRFSFLPSLHTTGFLDTWEGYSIHITDPEMDFGQSCGKQTGMTDGDRWPIYLGLSKNGTSKYFPVVLVKDGDHPYPGTVWNTVERQAGFPFMVHIPVIPLLERVEDCKKIKDTSLRDACYKLNTYAAAMSLREEQDKESQDRAQSLCRDVDFVSLSTVCKNALSESELLHKSRQFRGDYRFTSDVPGRQPQDLFPAMVADVPRTTSSMDDDGSHGTGRREYMGLYTSQTNPPAMITVQIEEFPNIERARKRLDELPGMFPSHQVETFKEEFQPGQKITRQRDAQRSTAFWISDNRIILIRFDLPFAKENAFIAAYLAKFPGSLQQTFIGNSSAPARAGN